MAYLRGAFLLLCLLPLLEAALVFNLIGTISDTSGVLPNGAPVNVTVVAKNSINGLINSGGKNLWGFLRSTANKGIPFKSIQITVNGMQYAFDFNKATADMWDSLYFSVDANTRTIEFLANLSSTATGIQVGTTGFLLTGIAFQTSLASIAPCSASPCQLEDILSDLIGATSATSNTMAMVTLYSSTLNDDIDVTISVTQFIVEEVEGGVKIEKAETYPTQVAFEAALAPVGIKLGKWDPTKLNITSTGVLTFGSYCFALYNGLDGSLGQISIPLGKFRVKSWGNLVSKAVLGLFGPSDLSAGTGLSYNLPSGLTARVFAVIARFDSSNNEVTSTPFQMEFTATVKLTIFYRFKTFAKTGINILAEGGKVAACDVASDFCKAITMVGTSTAAGATGSPNGAMPSLPVGMWAAFIPLLLPFLFLW